MQQVNKQPNSDGQSSRRANRELSLSKSYFYPSLRPSNGKQQDAQEATDAVKIELLEEKPVNCQQRLDSKRSSFADDSLLELRSSSGNSSYASLIEQATVASSSKAYQDNNSQQRTQQLTAAIEHILQASRLTIADSELYASLKATQSSNSCAPHNTTSCDNNATHKSSEESELSVEEKLRLILNLRDSSTTSADKPIRDTKPSQDCNCAGNLDAHLKQASSESQPLITRLEEADNRLPVSPSKKEAAQQPSDRLQISSSSAHESVLRQAKKDDLSDDGLSSQQVISYFLACKSLTNANSASERRERVMKWLRNSHAPTTRRARDLHAQAPIDFSL